MVAPITIKGTSWKYWRVNGRILISHSGCHIQNSYHFILILLQRFVEDLSGDQHSANPVCQVKPNCVSRVCTQVNYTYLGASSLMTLIPLQDFGKDFCTTSG